MNVRRWAQAPSIGSVLVVLVAVSASSAAPTVPPPRFGRSVDIGLVSGVVIVTPVAGRSFRLGTQDRNVPVGSVIDTRRGEVDLRSSRAPGDASAAANAVAVVQDAQFSRGRFKVLQRTSQRGLTVVDLITARNRHAVCATGSEASRTGRTLSAPGTRNSARPRQRRALPHPRTLQRRNCSRHDLGHHRPVRRNPHGRKPRNRRRVRLPPSPDNRRPRRSQLPRQSTRPPRITERRRRYPACLPTNRNRTTPAAQPQRTRSSSLAMLT